MIRVEDHVHECLNRITNRNSELNIFLHVAREEALGRARTLDDKRQQDRSGKTLGKLFGLCIGVKSNIAVRGLPLSCGSLTLKGYLAPYHADVVQRIEAEDGIIIGMLNMDEFACGSSGESSAFGPTKNPTAPERIPGGSSAGSAAAVAAGFVDLAIGSDTGGSIRNPASHCGVVGIKPSYGRVSRYGLVDLAMSLDQIGPLAPDTDGAALLLEVISGPSHKDARSITIPSFEASTQKLAYDYNNAKALTAHRPIIRVGIAPDLQNLCSDLRIKDAIETAARRLAAHFGSSLELVRLPHVHLAIQTYYPLVYVEFFSGTRKFDGRKFGKNIDDIAGIEVRRRIMGGKEIAKAEHQGRYYRQALETRAIIAAEILAAFEHVDVILSPVTPMLPHRLGETITVEQMYAYDAYTIPANLAGCCAASIPLCRIDSVPVGLHLLCKPFDEQLLIATMHAWEELTNQP